MQNVRKKKTFQAPTDLNSCVFSIGIILTSKPKWNFCVMSYSLVSLGPMQNYYFCFCANVCRAVTTRRRRNRHNFQWIQSKFREKEKFKLSSLVNDLKKTGNGKEIRQESVPIMHVQSVSSVQKICPFEPRAYQCKIANQQVWQPKCNARLFWREIT